MNISMEFLKPVLSVLKKYKVLLPSVVITIIAVLLFLAAASKGSEVKKKVETSARTARTVQSLFNDIPSRDEPEQIRIFMDKLEEEVNQIKELAAQSSQRDLITYKYKIFPKPDDQSQQIYREFGEQYRLAIEKQLESLNALDAPSDAEIRLSTGGGRPTDAYGGRPVRTTTAEDPRVDALCLRRAQSVSVYANASDFAWYPFWESYRFAGGSQSLEDCWDSQVAFWIYEDVLDTIQKMNSGADNVLSAPVKRILGVSFSGPVTTGSEDRSRTHSRTTEAAGFRDKPNYILPQLSQSSAQSSRSSSLFMDTSPTGRACNEDVDVIHFAVSVLVDNRFILPFMKELCNEKFHSFYPSVFEEPFIRQGGPVESRHNQITILQSDLKTIDKTAPAHEYYRYGKSAVVRLDLICEYQFVRAGYDPIKPMLIKEQLGQTVDEQGPGNTQGGTMPGGMRMPGMF